MRPIDADALMPLFIEKANKMKDRHGVKLGEEWLLNYDDIKDVIDNAPTVERPQGEWIELKTNPADFFGHRFYSCSKCGREIDVMTPEESLYDYPYCHCGACMIKEAEDGRI